MRIVATLVSIACALVSASGNTEQIGFNPPRKRVARRSDILFVGAAIAACVVLVLWTMFG